MWRSTYLDRPNVNALLTKHVGHGCGFDRISNRGTRAMALDKRGLPKVTESGCLIACANEGLLTFRARLGYSGRLPVKVAGGRPYNSANWVSISHGIIESLDIKRVDRLASSIAIYVGVKGSTGTIRT